MPYLASQPYHEEFGGLDLRVKESEFIATPSHFGQQSIEREHLEVPRLGSHLAIPVPPTDDRQCLMR